MKIYAKVRIRGLTHKMKNRVSNHGEWWVRKAFEINEALDPATVKWSLEPAIQRDPEKPYGCWVKPGVDFLILEEVDES